MKTIRIQYLTKLASITDVKQFFNVKEESSSKTNEQLTDPDFQSKVFNRHLHFIDDVRVDILVDDSFNPATILGTIIVSDGVDFKHEWAGHRDTDMVINKLDARRKPIKETDTKGGMK